MTLRALLYQKGVISDLKQTQVRCPFHDDHNPSATLDTNTLRCWSRCNKTYHLIDFVSLYGKEAFALEMAPELIREEEAEDEQKVVMFIGPAD